MLNELLFNAFSMTRTRLYVNKIIVEKHKSERKLEEEEKEEIVRKRRKRRRNNGTWWGCRCMCICIYVKRDRDKKNIYMYICILWSMYVHDETLCTRTEFNWKISWSFYAHDNSMIGHSWLTTFTYLIKRIYRRTMS